MFRIKSFTEVKLSIPLQKEVINHLIIMKAYLAKLMKGRHLDVKYMLRCSISYLCS